MGAARQALASAWATTGTPAHYEADSEPVAHYEELRDRTERW